MICLSTDPVVVDTFAGGGGAGRGIAGFLGRHPDIAINHDPKACEMYQRNAPDTMVVLEDVYIANLPLLVGGRRVAGLWASPDCKHFSRAKGGKPVNKQIRSLAWVIVKWAHQVKPERIFFENVREFKDWGPLLPGLRCGKCKWKGVEHELVIKRVHRYCPKCGSRRVEPLLVHDKKTGKTEQGQIPDPARKGLTFRRWCGRLRSAGYELDFRDLDAADYGVPTHRRRLFGVGRCDGKPIVWPEPTHCDPRRLAAIPLFASQSGFDKKPWRTAAECIDWSVPCPSIFGRKRDLRPATLARVAKGIVREVLENPRPFIVGVGGRMGQTEPAPIDQPSNTITAKNDRAIVTPYLVPLTHQGERNPDKVTDPIPTITGANRGEISIVSPYLVPVTHTSSPDRYHPIGEPSPTITTAKGGEFAIVSPTLIQTGYGERPGQSPRVPGLHKPLGTIVSGGKSALVSAFLSQFYGRSIGQSPDEPIGCITGKNHQAVVTAFLAKHYGGVVGHDLNRPLGTVTSVDHHSLVTANLVHMNHGEKQWSHLDEPMRTIVAGGTHAALVYSFLIKYYGTGISAHLGDPLDTITANDRFGLVIVVIDGQLWVMTDIGLRMLTPRELARCQGFDDGFWLSGNKTNDVARIGNSVPPAMSEALFRANCQDLLEVAA